MCLRTAGAIFSRVGIPCFLAIAAALVLMVAASRDSAATPNDEIEFETIDWGSDGFLESPGRALIAIDDEQQWVDFWADLHGNKTPIPDSPEIDFEIERVLAVLDSGRPSGGFYAEVSNIAVDGGLLQPTLTFSEPGGHCAVTAAITRPYHLVRMPSSDLPVEPIVIDQLVDCLVWADLDCATDASGEIDVDDALVVLRHRAGLGIDHADPCPSPGQTVPIREPASLSPPIPTSSQVWGDVDCSGSVSVIDAKEILEHLAGFADSLQSCSQYRYNVVVEASVGTLDS